MFNRRPHALFTLLLLIVAGTLSALPRGAAAQQARRVPGQYRTIQAAIDAAGAGDTVLVSAGTYPETIDFRGKSITVTTVAGPDHTILDARKRRIPTVSFSGGETAMTRLSGFTVTGSERCGIFVAPTANPTIVGNVVDRNANWVTQRGGGADCQGRATFIGTRFTNNIVANNSGIGGGLSGSANLINCIFFANYATYGGGVDGFGTMVGCVVIANSAEEGAGGIDGSFSVTNCIVWGNRAWYIDEIAGPATYSCVRGGHPGVGNISADPQILPGLGEFHLAATSPCINAGSNAAATYATDFEGDPRIHGGRVDIGADEFHPHLYHLGAPTPGRQISLRVAGPPGSTTALGFGTAVANAPIALPGLKGHLLVAPSGLVAFPLRRIPATGNLDVPLAVPAGFPPQSIPLQALVGTCFTNLELLHVR